MPSIDAVVARMRATGARPALFARGATVSYDAFFGMVDAWEARLREDAVGYGDRCGVGRPVATRHDQVHGIVRDGDVLTGFVVLVAGNMMLMPVLPKHPQSLEMDINEHAEIIGLR